MSARRSTMSHMSKLMATAALASTVACSKCGSMGGAGGYGVVDPMPMPARCYGGGVTATARWVPKPGGGRLLEIDVSASSFTSMGSAYVYSAPTITGGTIVDEPEPFLVATPIDASVAIEAGASGVRGTTDGGRADGGRADAGELDAGATSVDAGPATNALGPTVKTWRIEPTGASVHLVFDVNCGSAMGTLGVTASWGKTRDGGEELTTNVNEN